MTAVATDWGDCTHMFRRKSVLALVAASLPLSVTATPAAADVPATVTASAVFSDAVGGGGTVQFCGQPSRPPCVSGPETQVRWGVPASGSGRSGLGFDGVATTVTSADPFHVGTLSHFNFPINAGSGVEQVTMTVDVDVTVPAGTFGLSVPVPLTVDETPNNPPCAYGPPNGPCADAIAIGALGGDTSASQVLGDTRFTLSVVGFRDAAGNPTTQFISPEDGTNSAQLFAVLTQNSRPVADAGADQMVEQSGASTPVTLDGSASSDPDGDQLTHTWTSPSLAGPVSGSSPTVNLAPGTHTFTLTVSDGDLSASDTVEVTVADTVAPTITGSRTPAPNAAGWNNSDVTVSFSCTDAGSGVASCSGPTTLSSEGSGQSVTGTATDNAGNTASAVVSDVNIDKTAPSITFSGNAGTYALDQTVSITCQASDALAGLATSSCPGASGVAGDFGPGTHTLTATATDNAGNTETVSTSFTVQVTHESLCALARSYSTNQGVANSLCAKLAAAADASGRGQTTAAANMLEAFRNEVAAQSGKALTPAQAATLAQLSRAL